MEITAGTTSLLLVEGDITERSEDAIVNPANDALQHGGGLAGLIVRRGGRVIQEESDAIGHCPVGKAVVTGAGSLPAKFIIHAVGPRWGEGDEERKLASAVTSSLALAEEKGLSSVALPAISTGVFQYPLELAARVILKAATDYLNRGSSLERVVFVLYGQRHYSVFCDTLKGIND